MAMRAIAIPRPQCSISQANWVDGLRILIGSENNTLTNGGGGVRLCSASLPHPRSASYGIDLRICEGRTGDFQYPLFAILRYDFSRNEILCSQALQLKSE